MTSHQLSMVAAGRVDGAGLVADIAQQMPYGDALEARARVSDEIAEASA